MRSKQEDLILLRAGARQEIRKSKAESGTGGSTDFYNYYIKNGLSLSTFNNNINTLSKLMLKFSYKRPRMDSRLT